jgi:hypothetical protein
MRSLYFLSRPAGFLAPDLTRPPHPPIKYCMPILKIFEVTQKIASPLGNVMVNQANIIGIIHSIILDCDCCLGSAEGVITIFCCTHIVPPTSSARNISPVARFNQRK